MGLVSVDVFVLDNGSPKSQALAIIVLPTGAEDKLVNETSLFKHPILFEKFAIGATPDIVTLIVSCPTQLFVFVTTTEYCPEEGINKESLFDGITN